MTYKYFTLEEFNCQETGENRMDSEFIRALDILREKCGFPFTITSGYRSPNHSIEATKATPGQHAHGIAADIAVSGGVQRMAVVKNAIELGFTGIGVGREFVHVDLRKTTPVMWVY